jgi:son of sevenless-like protein
VTPVSSTFSQPESPWYLREDYPPDSIVLDEKGNVKAATLPALITRLTPHGSSDTAFFQAFLLTFRSFTTANELLDQLIERYNIPEPEGLTLEESADWKRLKQTPIRLRVSNTIRNWLDSQFVKEDLPLLDRVEEFAKVTLAGNGSALLSKQFLTQVERRVRCSPHWRLS